MSSSSRRRCLDLEAAGRRDVLEVDAAEARRDRATRVHDLVDASVVERHIGHASIPPNSLNRIAFPSITGSAASGPMFPSPSTAVPSVTTATAFCLIVRFQAFSGSSAIARRDARDTGRIGHREVVARLERHLRDDLELPAEMDQEGPVRDVLDLDAVECPDGLDDPCDVALVVCEHGHVTDLLPVLDADEVDRIEQPAGTGDRLGQQRKRSRPVLEVDAQGRAEGRGRMGTGGSFGAAVRAHHRLKREAGVLPGHPHRHRARLRLSRRAADGGREGENVRDGSVEAHGRDRGSALGSCTPRCDHGVERKVHEESSWT